VSVLHQLNMNRSQHAESSRVHSYNRKGSINMDQNKEKEKHIDNEEHFEQTIGGADHELKEEGVQEIQEKMLQGITGGGFGFTMLKSAATEAAKRVGNEWFKELL